MKDVELVTRKRKNALADMEKLRKRKITRKENIYKQAKAEEAEK